MDFNKVAHKWQKKWKDEKLFHVEVDKRKKYYIAIVYPYMSGLLHLGHLFTYTTPEILARYKRMRGFNVLSKFGFHCTGTPIVAAAQKVREKEPGQLATLKKMGIPESEIYKFINPEYWCDYFPKETLRDLHRMGFAIDERYTFRTTYLNPPYDKFITWQFNKLHEKGLVKKGKHPVVWCPKDNIPVGDHDRAEGEGETPQEFMLFKHKLDDDRFVISATLRQDTVLGITNLFMNPDAEYVEAEVERETWILGEKAAQRLTEQGRRVRIVARLKGAEFIGKKTKEFDGNKVLILPATFLDPNFGTGLVHSVPSDSADDLIALWDLQKNEKMCEKYDLDVQEVKKIKPIPVLDTPGYGAIAAETMLRKHGITSQDQRKELDQIKKELYKLSHYSSTFNDRYKKAFSVNLAGKKVEEGKDVIKHDLIEAGYATTYYEPTGKVVCRCLTECMIKIVSDQWFLEYNDPEWKKLAHKCLDQMKIYPEKVRKQFDYVIDWLDHWACTREFGLGTKLPWDDKWVIESLSDSTMQMSYCTISKYLEHPEDYGFSVDKLNDVFFDFVYLGKGESTSVAESTGIPKKMIETMRRDFEYWSPHDFRNSAKDLVQNHLTFSLFNYSALLPQKHWPKAYVINGRIMVNNEKMSKSKGNFFTMRELYEKHGPDIVRLTAANAGEGVDDANYDMTFLETAKKKLGELYDFVKDNYDKGRTSTSMVDKWFESKIHEAILTTTEALENMLFKSAVQASFLDMQRALKWYINRTGNKPNKKLVNFFCETIVKLMSPITPHFSEECWGLIGRKGFVSSESWPESKTSVINRKLDYNEELIRTTVADIRSVLKLARLPQVTSIDLFVSPAWKYSLFKRVRVLIEKKSKNVLKSIMREPQFKKRGQDIAKFLPKMVSTRKIPATVLSRKDELTVLQEAAEFLHSEFNAEVNIIEAHKSDEKKALQALPGKPAILVR